jgi:adenine-specific DNA-methyltransferase
VATKHKKIMQNLYNELIELLEQDPALIIEDKLNKALIIDRALKLDSGLLKLLLSSPSIKKHFFQEIEGVHVFDKIAFQRFVNSKQFLPDSYTQFKNKIGLSTNNENYLTDSREVVLVWPHKDCVLEGGQTKEDAKRNEIFYNQTLAPDDIDRLTAPKVLTNWKRYDKEGEHPVTKISKQDNLIIKGNNLLALHTLKELYRGQVKLIYIDPPYNTGNDSFGYNDNFNHSTWLTFMKNRLEVAHSLLAPDGTIFIQCDDIELSYLKVLGDEIFTRENFINVISYERSGSAGIGQGGRFVDTTEFILIYEKNKNHTKFNEVLKSSLLDFEVMKRYNKILSDKGSKSLLKEFKSKSNGEPVKIYKHENYKVDTIPLKNFAEREVEIRNVFLANFEGIFRTTNPQAENSFQQELLSQMEEGLYSVEYIPSRGKNKNEPTTIFYLNNEIFAWLKDTAIIDKNTVVKQEKISTMWVHAEIPKADLANEGNVELKRGKKPEQLLKRIIDLSTKEGDIVLDFHLGSGTTAAVAHKMKRQYLGIEQLDYGNNDSVKRLKNVIDGDSSGISKSVNWQGGGSFIYLELLKNNQQYINEIQTATKTEQLKKLWAQMQQSAFISYKVLPQKINTEIKEFEALSFEEQQRFLVEVLDKNLLYVNYSEINDATNKVCEADKELNVKFYSLLSK